jgi:alkylation response protein AidB-like acyl-CoA dehydrogenase
VDFSRIVLNADQEQFLSEVRSFLDEIMTEEVLEEERTTGAGFNLGVHLALGQKGWLLAKRPREQGGAGLDPVRRAILDLEIDRYGVARNTWGTTLLTLPAVEKFCNPALLEEIMPKIADGRVRICLGYTEPDGGSDIAAAKVRAVRDGDQWVINGSKIFTTGAQFCQYTFLITRTDPDLPKHKGLTMFLVPLDTPGVEIQPIRTYGGETTNIVYYGDVRIDDRYRVGEVNDGWNVLHGPLDQEHDNGAVGDDLQLTRWYMLTFPLNSLNAALKWAVSSERPDGSRVIDDRSVKARLGRAATDIETAISTPTPMGRVRRADVAIESSAALVDLIGPEALLTSGSDGAVAEGAIDFAHRWAQGTAIYGGTTLVFRNIIAQHVLGLPRPSYPGSKAFIKGSTGAR